MILPKLKKKAKRFWRKSVKRMNFGVLRQAAVVLLLVGLNISGLSTIVGRTSGYFSDIENSSANVFSADLFDLTAAPQGDFAPVSLLPGQSADRHIDVGGESMPFNYNISASGSFGDFCDNLNLQAKFGGDVKYNGPIAGLDLSPIASMSAGQADWEFIVSLPAGSPEFPGSVCQFNFVFAGWQGDSPAPSGFSDVEEVSAVILGGQQSPPAPSGVVLNEFLPRPHDDGGVKPDGEWVELYNLSTKSIDLAGYYLKDKLDPTSGPSHKIYIENCRTNTGGTIIGPNGFLVVYAKGERGEEGDSCNSYGFELNNAGDTVRLFNDGGEMIDYYSYDGSVYCSLTPTPGDPNENDSSGSCPGVVPKNKSFARVPDGTGPWYDPIPTPGGPNVLEEEQEPIVDLQNENQNASLSFSETLGAVAGAITEFVLGEEEVAVSASTSTEFSEPAPVASGSGEPLVEPLSSPEASPEVSPSPELSPEPSADSASSPQADSTSGSAGSPSTDSPQAGEDGPIQILTEPVIPVEPVIIEVPTEPVPPPADPLAPPVEAPAPAPEAPAAPTE